jgi:hypothetical protein
VPSLARIQAKLAGWARAGVPGTNAKADLCPKHAEADRKAREYNMPGRRIDT